MALRWTNKPLTAPGDISLSDLGAGKFFAGMVVAEQGGQFVPADRSCLPVDAPLFLAGDDTHFGATMLVPDPVVGNESYFIAVKRRICTMSFEEEEWFSTPVSGRAVREFCRERISRDVPLTLLVNPNRLCPETSDAPQN